MLKIQSFVLLILLASSNLYGQSADDIIGKYHLPNQLDVEIFKSNGAYYGKIIALNMYANGQQKDLKNPDPSKRNTPLLGKTIIKNLTYDAKDMEWTNGEMYNPEKGMTFNLKVKKVKKNKIVVIGSKYLFWKTIEWEKIN